MKNHLGLIYAMSAYLWWGIIPIFWKQLDHIPSMEIVAHRMVWAALIVVALIVSMKEWKAFVAVFKDKVTLLRLCAASLLVMTNWAIFIWAVNNDHIVETSLGYFINPLISVFFGLIFFGETLRKGQSLALLLAAFGVLVMIVATGGVPIVSLSLAITFALYSVMKKKVSLPATHGLAIETLFTLLPAAAYLLFLDVQGTGSFAHDAQSSIMLILGGLFTLIPLLLFAAAAKRVSMTALGMTQYLGPTCQLLIGVLIYNEPFGSTELLAFGFIWFALAIYSVDQLKAQSERRKARKLASA
ncbi:EamA family transporter RarD [Arenicella sp. 4NH20-0111]|uniref:EamA family transporter RarD n=1 Tax=Arenicella sp. 4NH20-0111 TaxID=3127648 RepID=UPI00310B1A42